MVNLWENTMNIKFKIFRDKRIISVMHLGLGESYWKRGGMIDERDVAKVRNVIQDATGLMRVTRFHTRFAVCFRINKKDFNKAAVAVRMNFGRETGSSLLRLPGK